MFFNEAHIAGALDHPNIMKILGAGDEAGEPYIVMELVVGGRNRKDYCSHAKLLLI
jgi:serine/threonine protein kinase